MPRILLAVAVMALGFTGCRRAPADGGLSAFVDEYFDAQFAFSPSDGTRAGFHQYDARMNDLSAGAFQQRIDALKSFQQRLAKLRAGRLSASDEIDAAVLDGCIRSELLDLETLALWRRNPMLYVMLPGEAVDALMKRDFAPAAARLRPLVARLKAIPAVLDAMRANIENPPKEFTDLAIRMAGGSVGFYRGTVADWGRWAAGSDAALRQDFEQANQAAAAAMARAAEWLTKDLLPRSKGDFAIGEENFRNKLLYDEMIDLPLDQLRKIGEATLARDHQAFVDTARQIDPSKPAAAVMKEISAGHPAEAGLLGFAKETLETTRGFLVSHGIVTVPSEVRPIVTETPPYARSGSFASMDTPGAYEKRATEAYYYITPPEKNWTPEQREQHLRLFNPPVMDLITIHEAYPGHFLQFLYAKQYPTKTRKLIFCGTNAEGWAHYAEQMMVEEGFGAEDPKIRLAQLSEALTRDCRFVVGIGLHAAGMTVAQGALTFENQCFSEPQVGFEEARRGTYNPTYLYYTLGKLEIYKLRQDYQKARGAKYRLRDFHDGFVRQGGIPIPLVRRILLPGDKGPVL